MTHYYCAAMHIDYLSYNFSRKLAYLLWQHFGRVLRIFCDYSYVVSRDNFTSSFSVRVLLTSFSAKLPWQMFTVKITPTSRNLCLFSILRCAFTTGHHISCEPWHAQAFSGWGTVLLDLVCSVLIKKGPWILFLFLASNDMILKCSGLNLKYPSQNFEGLVCKWSYFEMLCKVWEVKT